MEYSNADNYKVVLFGITGGTGSLIARSLLARGHKVAAVARHPEKVSLLHTELQIRKGDVLQPETFSDLIKNSDVVISAIGDRSGKPTTGKPETFESVIEIAN
jgi:putative NADH-flavin reductase